MSVHFLNAFQTLLLGFFWFSVVCGDLRQPISTADPQTNTFFKSKEQQSFFPPQNIQAHTVVNKAIPTNSWWGHLTGSATTDHPLFAYPYSLVLYRNTKPFGLAVQYSRAYRFENGQTQNGASQFYGHATFISDIQFSAMELELQPVVNVMDWSDLGMDIEIVPQDGIGKITTSSVNGMAYVTAQYESLTPKLLSRHAMLSVNGENLALNHPISGTKFKVVFNNGMTWIVYASEQITWHYKGGLVADQVFNGNIRVAILKGEKDEEIYDRYKDCIVRGADVKVPNANSYIFQWRTEGACSNGLLHFGLEHHLDSLDKSNVQAIDALPLESTTHGRMFALVTTSTASTQQWIFHEKLAVKVDFYPSLKPPTHLLKKYNVLKHLKQEIEQEWGLSSQRFGNSYYFNGKLAQKYATLCLLANDATLTGRERRSLSTQCIAKLQEAFVPLLENRFEHRLVYDEIYKGIVSSAGFTFKNVNADFGNTVYNDHHYHYGYWITAAAMLKSLAPTWERMKELDVVVELLLRDVANPSTDDAFFPSLRHFSWYLGHSYSHGLIPLDDGKDIESSSEEVNLYYGMTLWGRVSSRNRHLESLGQLLLKINARSIQKYMLIENDSTVHPESFKPNKVCGIFFDNKVDYATYFSPDREKIHGIQMIPVSPINSLFRSTKFIKEEWDQVLSTLEMVKNPTTSPDAWLSILMSNYARINKKFALDVLSTTPLDDGLSRAWALYMAASHPEESIKQKH